MVPLMGNVDDEDTLRVAMDLATTMQACVRGLQIAELPIPAYNAWSILPDYDMSEVYDQIRHAAQSMAAKWRTKFSHHGVSITIDVVDALYVSPWSAVVHEAPCADLIVVASHDRGNDDASGFHRNLVPLLLRSGRPLLVIPRHAALTEHLSRAVVAWKNVRESIRALHDALPLLKHVETIDVVTVDAPEDMHIEMEALLGHLSAHGIQASWVARRSNGTPVAEILMVHATHVQAGVLVAGGYGHSRLHEWVLGGVTRELLEHAELPLFLSH
ncbi:universal stress protein [Dyella sp.]|uniref:universal stress protein n=1 Tax=Dyella sp. TaxID=1869338 RepID=UPI002ED0C770